MLKKLLLAGAVGVVIMNQGNTDAEDRNGIPAVTFGNGNTSGIPALGTTYALGAELSQIVGLEMRVFANSSRTLTQGENVLAETRTGDDDDVVRLGVQVGLVSVDRDRLPGVDRAVAGDGDRGRAALGRLP